MFKFVVFAACVAFVAAAATSDDMNAEVKTEHSEVRPDGFEYILETTNNIHQDAAGDEHGNIHGSYEYISPEGEHIKVSYVADENGYQPSSDLLPTSPPVPAHILKAIEYINSHPSYEESNTKHK